MWYRFVGGLLAVGLGIGVLKLGGPWALFALVGAGAIFHIVTRGKYLNY